MIQVGPYTLEDFQESTFYEVRNAVLKGYRQILLVSPTGSGKTIMAAAIIQATVAKGNRVWFITSGRQLIFQMARTLEEMGIDFTVLMSGSGYGYHDGAAVTVVSKDTLESRMKKGTPHTFPAVAIVDECDVAMSKSWWNVLDECELVIGLTATPCDGQGKGLGAKYECMVEAASFSDLIKTGRLVDIPEGNVFCPYRPDLTGAKLSGGDYSGKWLNERMDRTELVGDIVQEWMKHSEGRPTVVFCSGVQHSIHVAEAFCGQGIPAEHIDGTTPQDERDAMFARLGDGRTNVITNCAVLDRGWNQPIISCGVLAKPTKRLRAYTQMVGRLIRSAPGKSDAILIDHAGAVFQHGWPTSDRQWSLDGDERIEDRELERQQKNNEQEPRCCPQCACMWTNSTITCPNCGYQQRKRGKPAVTADGELVEVKRKDIKKATDSSDVQKSWMRLLGMCANSGRKYTQASVMFKSKTGKWPEAAGVSPVAEQSQRGMKVAAIWPGFRRGRK